MGLSNLLQLASLCLAAAIIIGGFWIGSGHYRLPSSTSEFQNASGDGWRSTDVSGSLSDSHKPSLGSFVPRLGRKKQKNTQMSTVHPPRL